MESVLDHAHRYVTGQAFRSIFLFIARYGLRGFVDAINKRCNELYMGTSTASVYGTIGLNNKIAQMCEEEGIDPKDLAGLQKIGNFYFIKVKEKKNVSVDGL